MPSRFGRVLEGPEHGLVVDGTVALVQHALDVDAGRRGCPQDLGSRLHRCASEVVMGHDPGQQTDALSLGGVEAPG